MAIELDKDVRKEAIESIQRYFDENHEERIGNIQAGALLNFFVEELGPVIYNIAIQDAQERLQARHLNAPLYEVVEATGPPHRRTFHVEVKWEGGSVRAQGRTIKAAETVGARLALEAMESTEPETKEEAAAD